MMEITPRSKKRIKLISQQAIYLSFMNKKEMLAVHKKKLEEFLRSVGLWDSLAKGELKCVICGEPISVDNIGLIIPSKDKIVLCCSKSECMFKIKEMRSGKSEG
jgi:hypothetical protein